MPDLAAAVQHARSVQEKAHARATVDLPLPLHGGAVGGRFGLLSEDAQEAFALALERADDLTTDEDDDVACQMIADSLRCVVSNAEGQWEPVVDRYGEVGFDERLAEAFGLELREKSSAAVVHAVWTLDDGTFNRNAVKAFAVNLMQWMQDTSQPLRGELVGESAGGLLLSQPVGPPSSE